MLFKTIIRHSNCFLSFVTSDGKDQDMDWNLKELDDIFQVVKKSLWFIVLPDEFVWYVVDNSTAAYQLCMGKSMK